MIGGRFEELLCWVGSATGLGSMALNAALSDLKMQFFVFVVMSVSCVATLGWAFQVRNKVGSSIKPLFIEETIYLGIACIGMATHAGALGMG